MLLQQFSDDFVFLLDLRLQRDDLSVFRVVLFDRLPRRLESQSGISGELLLPGIDSSNCFRGRTEVSLPISNSVR